MMQTLAAQDPGINGRQTEEGFIPRHSNLALIPLGHLSLPVFPQSYKVVFFVSLSLSTTMGFLILYCVIILDLEVEGDDNKADSMHSKNTFSKDIDS
jgi:hypothetical protein